MIMEEKVAIEVPAITTYDREELDPKVAFTQEIMSYQPLPDQGSG
jgi:hypothetical protein